MLTSPALGNTPFWTTTGGTIGHNLARGALRGGAVMPCSLDGVNPVYHPDIFGNPTAARSYGFVLGPDRVWRVRPDCSRLRHY